MANDKTTAPQVDLSRLPRHVAIILDGNGRWAKKRGLPRTAGHAYGAEAFRRIGNYCKAIGIEYLTVYAFSTENWRRPPEEVRTIMSIFDKYMKEALSIMERDRFKMRFFGERSGLSPELQRLMAAAEEKSTHYDGCQMNLCINYGGRDEILHAVRRYAEAYKAGTAPELTEDVFSNSGPRPHHPHERGAAAEQLPALAGRVLGAVLYRRALAGLYRARHGRGPGGVPAARPALWRREMTAAPERKTNGRNQA